eukprot:2559538-Amphidinium_carterae.1
MISPLTLAPHGRAKWAAPLIDRRDASCEFEVGCALGARRCWLLPLALQLKRVAFPKSLLGWSS